MWKYNLQFSWNQFITDMQYYVFFLDSTTFYEISTMMCSNGTIVPVKP